MLVGYEKFWVSSDITGWEKGDVKLYEGSDGTWEASEFGTWVEGVYDSPEAAESAVNMDPDKLHESLMSR